MRAQPFNKQQATGRLGERLILQMYPDLTWVSKDPDKSTSWDFEDTEGKRIELKTCTTYPNVYVNDAILKNGEWEPYGPKLSVRNKVDSLYYLFLDKNRNPYKLLDIKPKAFVRAMKKQGYITPQKTDSNKVTRIYNIDDITDSIRKNVSWRELSCRQATPYVVLANGDDKAEWLAARRNGIGCSEVAILLGDEKFKTKRQLFDEKVWSLKEEVTDPKTIQRFWWGHAMEPVMTDWCNEFAIENFGGVREWQKLLQSTSVKGLIGTPDARTDSALVEYKTTSPRNYTNMWESGRRVPKHYYYQVQAQMLLTGLGVCYVVVCRQIGIALRVLKVERNEEICCRIAKVVTEFWEAVLAERKKHGIY